jgi:hypothetical protein
LFVNWKEFESPSAVAATVQGPAVVLAVALTEAWPLRPVVAGLPVKLTLAPLVGAEYVTLAPLMGLP